MTVITTRIMVGADGSISTAVPLPAGEYEVRVEVADDEPYRPLRPSDFPKLDVGAWPTGKSFGRDELYDDDGR